MSLKGCGVCFVAHILFLMQNPVTELANTRNPDQMPHDVASDLGLYCLPMTLLRKSR